MTNLHAATGRAGHRTCALTALLVQLALTPAAVMGQQLAAGDHWFSIAQGSTRTPGVLPFDVDLSLAGAAGKQVVLTAVEYRPYGRHESPTCRSFYPPPPLGGKATWEKHRADMAARSDAGEWRSAQSTPQGRKIAADSFRIAIGPLRANQRYLFCLTLVQKLSDEDSRVFRDSAARAVTNIVLQALVARSQGMGGDPTLLRSLQQAIVKALPAADVRVSPPGSLLDSEPPESVLREEFAELSSPAGNIEPLRRSIDTAGQLASTELTTLASTHRTVLERLGSARLQGRTAAETDQRTRTAQFAAGLAMVRERAQLAAVVAVGERPLDPREVVTASADLATVQDTAETNLRLRHLDSSLVALATLRELVEGLAADAAARTAAGVGDLPAASFRALAADLEHVRRLLLAQATSFGSLGNYLAQLRGAAAAIAGRIATADLPRTAFVGTTRGDFITRARWHISADIGVLHAPRAAEATSAYAGVNFYVIPVNKQMPVWHCPWNALECMAKRTSLTIALTTNSVARSGRIADLFGTNAALAGIGFRLTDYLRLSAGALFVRRITDTETNASVVTARLAYAASVDIDVRDLLGPFGSLLPK